MAVPPRCANSRGHGSRSSSIATAAALAMLCTLLTTKQDFIVNGCWDRNVESDDGAHGTSALCRATRSSSGRTIWSSPRDPVALLAPCSWSADRRRGTRTFRIPCRPSLRPRSGSPSEAAVRVNPSAVLPARPRSHAVCSSCAPPPTRSQGWSRRTRERMNARTRADIRDGRRTGHEEVCVPSIRIGHRTSRRHRPARGIVTMMASNRDHRFRTPHTKDARGNTAS